MYFSLFKPAPSFFGLNQPLLSSVSSSSYSMPKVEKSHATAE